MRCTCGAEIRPGTRFCGKCGRPVANEGLRCPHCSSTLTPGAGFCGKCGTRISPAITPTPSPAPAPTPAPTPSAAAAAPRFFSMPSALDRTRIKKLLLIILIIGLSLLATGLAGKIVMDTVSSQAMASGIFPTDDVFGGYVNSYSNQLLTKFFVSIVRNDSSVFSNTMGQMTGFAGNLAGDASGLGGMLFSAVLPGMFDDMRASLQESAGPLWILLRIMAYYSEILTIGIIATIAAGVLLFLMKARFRDIITLRLKWLLVAGGVWSGLILLVSIILPFL